MKLPKEGANKTFSSLLNPTNDQDYSLPSGDGAVLYPERELMCTNVVAALL